MVTCALLVGGWDLFSRAGLEKLLEYREGSAFQIESIPGSLIRLFSHHPVLVRYKATTVSDDGWTYDRVSAGVWLLSLAVVLHNVALRAVLAELFRIAFARQDAPAAAG